MKPGKLQNWHRTSAVEQDRSVPGLDGTSFAIFPDVFEPGGMLQNVRNGFSYVSGAYMNKQNTKWTC